ncbi:PEGA domain-containing protein [Patescibacteria group bacterium]|nr:PEGA domain-containing protein [Patescibacteria group bacterium]
MMDNASVCYFGNISFISYPGEAEVFIDGMDQGIKTPAAVTGVPTGMHTFTVRLEGYNDFSGTVEVLENQTVNVPPAILMPAPGCIFFDSKPEGAKIFMNGTVDKAVNTGFVTPKLICGLPLGVHVYRLILDGYQVSAGSVNLKPGQGASVTAKFV